MKLDWRCSTCTLALFFQLINQEFNFIFSLIFKLQIILMQWQLQLFKQLLRNILISRPNCVCLISLSFRGGFKKQLGISLKYNWVSGHVFPHAVLHSVIIYVAIILSLWVLEKCTRLLLKLVWWRANAIAPIFLLRIALLLFLNRWPFRIYPIYPIFKVFVVAKSKLFLLVPKIGIILLLLFCSLVSVSEEIPELFFLSSLSPDI